MNELVSVIIPCYRQARFLGEAIESVLRQTYPSFEIVVVDDGSPDDTAEVAARYAGVRCLRQDNRGLARARNAGLGASHGTRVVFLDADDRLLPNALATGVAALARHSALALVFGHHRRIASDGSPRPTPREPCVAEDYYEALLRTNCITTPATVMFRRASLDALGDFDPAVNAAADYDLYLRLARRRPIRCHHVDVAEYRLHADSMTRNVSLMLEQTLTVHRRQRAYALADPVYRRAYADGRRFIALYWGSRLSRDVRLRLRRGDWSGAARGLVALARYYPAPFARAIRRWLTQPVWLLSGLAG